MHRIRSRSTLQRCGGPEEVAGNVTKFEEMLEKRSEAGVEFLRCPFLWLQLRLRVG